MSMRGGYGHKFPKLRMPSYVLLGALCLYLGFIVGSGIFGEALNDNPVLFCAAGFGSAAVLYAGGWLLRRGLRKFRTWWKAEQEPYEEYRNEGN